MTFRFDFALSFSGEDREIAREIRNLLKSEGFSVFFDEDFEHEMIGIDASRYLHRVYAYQARYCIVLISRQYDKRFWTQLERESIQSRELTGENETLIPVKVEDYAPEWLPATRIYFDLDRRPISHLISLLKRKAESGPYPREIERELSIAWEVADINYRQEKIKAYKECKASGLDLELHAVQLVSPLPVTIKRVKEQLTDLLKKRVELDLQQIIVKAETAEMSDIYKAMGRVQSEFLDVLQDFRLCLTNYGLSGIGAEDYLEEFKRHSEAIIRSVILPGGVGTVSQNQGERN